MSHFEIVKGELFCESCQEELSTNGVRWRSYVFHPACARVIGESLIKDAREATAPPAFYRCKFCGKSQRQVEKMIAGPATVTICCECIDLCNEIIEEERTEAAKLVTKPLRAGDLVMD